MIIALYIFLGFLFFDCLVACCLYFRKLRLFDTSEVLFNHQKIVKLTKYGKTTKGNMTPGFVHQL